MIYEYIQSFPNTKKIVQKKETINEIPYFFDASKQKTKYKLVFLIILKFQHQNQAPWYLLIFEFDSNIFVED